MCFTLSNFLRILHAVQESVICEHIILDFSAFLNNTYVYIGFTGFVATFAHWNFMLNKRIGKKLDIGFN